MLALVLLASALAVPYHRAPPVVETILDTPWPPSVHVSPDGRWMAEATRPTYLPIAELAEPMERLAGLRIDPRTNGPARQRHIHALTLRPVRAYGEGVPLDFGEHARLGSLRWSREGDRLAFTWTRDDGIELWVVAVEDPQPRRLVGPVLNAAHGDPCDWLPGDQGLVCKVVPEERGEAPVRAEVPEGPDVEHSVARRAPSRTWADLLRDEQDEALFEHYLGSAVDLVTLDGHRSRLLEPALVDEVTPSPDGRYLLVRSLHRPFSTQVPARRFPTLIEVYDRESGLFHPIADLPLADDVPVAFGSVRQGRRTVGWRGDHPATLYWVEALDGGDAGAEAELRDALRTLEPPFRGDGELIWRSGLRLSRVRWGREDLALVDEWWWETRQTRTWRVDPSGGAEPALLWDRSYQDHYSDPGRPVMGPGPHGVMTLRFAREGDALFLVGRGVGEDGVHPFLDRLDLRSGRTTRLWRSRAPYHESVVALLAEPRFLTLRESPVEPPSYWIRKPGKKKYGKPVIGFGDPAPEFTEVRREVVRYLRDDGVQLSATLYLPPGYQEGVDRPLPTLLWVYPDEYRSRDHAGQVTTAEHAFRRPRGASPLFLVLQGYAVLEDPRLPIVGEGDEEPNDTYVEQLVAGARAAVDHLVERGVADRERLAVGGHSYGAFTAANLLAHTDLFRAGIARSGAYNRSLTPFGFQGEQRTFWEASDTYLRMSPFTHAHLIDEPLLLIHGAEDPNAGTWPMQSERLYEAMRGLGGTARWVELPLEGHGYRGRESVGHVVWEMLSWCDRHVKRPPPR